MATTMQSIFSLCSCTTLMVLLLTQIPELAESKTLESDIEVLHSLKQSVDPSSIFPSSFISTWNFILDPCESPETHFLGVACTVPEDNSSSRITVIELEGDGLEGLLTPIIGNLTELTTLNIRRNRFRGSIPNSLVNLTKITKIMFSGNLFSGSIPDGFGALKSLQVIDLSENRLAGSIPASISGFRRLNHLGLSHNEFSGRIPDLRGLWQLDTLDLSSNQLDGNLPYFPKFLRSLSLSRNLLSGHITTPVNRLRYLRTLDLSDNSFSGSIDQYIFALPEIRYINVSSNTFTEVEMIRMSNRPSQLTSFHAQNNRLQGHLPLNLITYQSLAYINLGHNLFSGEIPVAYGKLIGREWRSLILDNNMLEGSVPPGFSSAVTVRCSLAQNCLKCPHSIPFCRGGQRPTSMCVGRKF